MSDSDVDYLQPGFDPSSLTNPRLRSILVTYNIHYASNAKKPDLVELFNTHVAPQASKILDRRARAKRSSMGIVDAEASQSTATFDDDPEPQTERRRRTTRKVKEELADEDEEAERRQRRSSPRKRQTRSTSYQPAPPASDTDTAPDVDAGRHMRATPARRSRTKTPQVKLEPTEEEQDLLPPARLERQQPQHHRQSSTDDDTVFTDDNPFQSGSSPLTAASSSGKSFRRKTTGSESATQKRSSAGAVDAASSRRRTDGPAGVSTSSSFAYDTPPASRARWSPLAKAPSLSPEPEPEPESDPEPEPVYDDDLLAPGEEFTPEEQLELAQEEEVQRQQRGALSSRASGKQAAPSRRRQRRGFLSLATPLWVLGLTLLGAYGAWYRQEKIAVGYCGLGRPAVPLLADQLDKLPEWVRDVELPPSLSVLVEPQCEPCPLHAFCYSDYSVTCESGYIVKPHPLALGGLVPLPPTCEPDGERARRVKAVADKAVEELRDRRAKYECGDLVDDKGQPAESPAIDEPVLKEVISSKRSKKMNKDEFDDLWKAAIGDIETRDEVEVEPAAYETADSRTIPSRLSSSSLARLPLTCAIRRSIRLALARYRLPLSILGLAVLAVVYLRARFRARRRAMAQVPSLVDVVLARLAAQKELWLYDDEGDFGHHDDGADPDTLAPDPFLFLPQLRDDVLRSTHSLAARERVWKHVRAVVEQNSNVRTGQREGRNGEVGRAWEWIGPVGTTTSSSGGGGGSGSVGGLELSAARRRRSGRMSSWAPESRAATPRESAAVPQSTGGNISNNNNNNNNNTAAAVEADASREHRSALHRRWQESRPIY